MTVLELWDSPPAMIGSNTPALGDDSLRERRVLMIRSSLDGRRWEPAVSLSDVWHRNGHISE